MKFIDLCERGSINIADGAMGTYFSAVTGEKAELCEISNLTQPDTVKSIHDAYIRAGASLIRTNTFSANTRILKCSVEKILKIIRSGYRIAAESAKNKAVVCADVSVIYYNDDIDFNPMDEYRRAIDTWLDCGAETFIFETLPNMDCIAEPMKYILSKKPDAEIIACFTVLPEGRTRSGTSLEVILADIKKHESELAAVGLNCGCGPAQLYENAKNFMAYISHNTNLHTLIFPNAGYPSIEKTHTLFASSPSYFAGQTERFAELGFGVIGGCCGTTPEHISLLRDCLERGNFELKIPKKITLPETQKLRFSSKLAKKDFVIATELDPPYGSDLTKLISSANLLKDCGVDIVTISDSPLGHAKMDSVICSSSIYRTTGIETLPHLCCRDRNINALRSLLLGAHSEGIRSVLVVTGDPIAETDRGVIKPVFNFSSTQLMKMISQMNSDVFSGAPIAIGGAFNPDPAKADFALKRLQKKMEAGATFFLTQAVFSDNVIPVIDHARSMGAKILVGIMPIVTYRNACFLSNEVPGIHVPHELIRRFSPDMNRAEGEAAGLEIACDLAQKLRPHADGFYFMTPFNRANVICNIIRRLGIDK